MGIDIINDIDWKDIANQMKTDYNKKSALIKHFNGLSKLLSTDTEKK